MAPSSPVADECTGAGVERWGRLARAAPLVAAATLPALVGERLRLEEAPHQLVVARDHRDLGGGRAGIVEQAASGLGQ